MNRALLWRSGTVIGTALMALLYLYPSLVSELPSWWASFLPNDKIHLGLDLQGGIHMVLEVDADKAVENSVDLLGEQIRRELREKEIATRGWRRDGMSGLEFELVSRSRADEVKEYLRRGGESLV